MSGRSGPVQRRQWRLSQATIGRLAAFAAMVPLCAGCVSNKTALPIESRFPALGAIGLGNLHWLMTKDEVRRAYPFIGNAAATARYHGPSDWRELRTGPYSFGGCLFEVGFVGWNENQDFVFHRPSQLTDVDLRYLSGPIKSCRKTIPEIIIKSLDQRPDVEKKKHVLTASSETTRYFRDIDELRWRTTDAFVTFDRNLMSIMVYDIVDRGPGA